jgi:PBP1b-binding outer membrane lipoprotein LpoB
MDGATSRAEPRDLPKRSRRLAGSRPRVLAAASLAIAAMVFAGCSGGGDSSSSSSDSSPSSTAAPAAKTNVAVPLGEVIADSAGAPAQFTP